MRDRQRKVGREHVDPCQRAPRSTHHVEGAAARLLFQRRFLERGFQQPSRLTFAAGAGVQPKHAERKRNAGACLAVRNIHQLETAAAEVADNAIRCRNAREHAFAGKRRFLLGAQHRAIEADPLHLADELKAVLGITDCSGRHNLRSLHLHLVEKQLETAERRERLRARLLRQLA